MAGIVGMRLQHLSIGVGHAGHVAIAVAGANGTDSYTSTSSTHIVDSANNASDYGFATIGGAGYVNSITGSGCASCGNSQPGTSTFVLKHIDESVPGARLAKIASNARSECPARGKSLCASIVKATGK